MAVDNIRFEWKEDFQGRMFSPNGSLPLGSDIGEMRPYHLLFGALGGCFYSTFVGIAKKKRLLFSGAKMEISGVKREEVPTTLKEVLIKLVIMNPSNENQFLKTAELSAEHCSVHETIAKVAKIDLEVSFEYLD